jgi:Rab-GTPase-TBC domain
MQDMFMPKMPGLSKAFYVHLSLMKKYMPKLHVYLLNNKFEPSMYASQWFMTIFSVNFPFEFTVRIWDMFLIEGKKVLFRVALAIFKMN